jgi:hypothetical protein
MQPLDNDSFALSIQSSHSTSVLPTSASGPSPPKVARSRQEEQLEFLLHRQQQFKEAALLAKKRGDIEGAKKFLLQAKVRTSNIYASTPIF